MTALSVLDLVPVPSGSSAPQAVQNALKRVQHVENEGYHRWWVAEHHNMRAVASSVPLALLAAASQVTSRIRLGAGGVMLPNHAPLSVAEGYRLLSALAPGRVDLGLGRAPGTDGRTALALRGPAAGLPETPFEYSLADLIAYGSGQFPATHPFAGTIAAPAGEGLFPPLWLLSSSGYGAATAAAIGAGLAFAWHINPDTALAHAAVESYRLAFRPSPDFPEPRVIVAANVVCAPTTEEAEELSLSLGLMFLRLRLNQTQEFPSVAEAKAYPYTPEEWAVAQAARSRAIVGNPAQVTARLRELATDTDADEVMVSMALHDPPKQLRGYSLLMESWQA